MSARAEHPSSEETALPDHESLPFYDNLEIFNDFWNIVGDNFDMSEDPWNLETSIFLEQNTI